MQIFKARPRWQTQQAQQCCQWINQWRAGADFTIPGMMSVKDGEAYENDAAEEAILVNDNYPPLAHYYADGYSHDAQCVGLGVDKITVLYNMWQEYLAVPSWETYKNNWETLASNVTYLHFWILSREDTYLYLAYAQYGDHNANVYDLYSV
jgi:hypothetical protein